MAVTVEVGAVTVVKVRVTAEGAPHNTAVAEEVGAGGVAATIDPEVCVLSLTVWTTQQAETPCSLNVACALILGSWCRHFFILFWPFQVIWVQAQDLVLKMMISTWTVMLGREPRGETDCKSHNGWIGSQLYIWYVCQPGYTIRSSALTLRHKEKARPSWWLWISLAVHPTGGDQTVLVTGEVGKAVDWPWTMHHPVLETDWGAKGVLVAQHTPRPAPVAGIWSR